MKKFLSLVLALVMTMSLVTVSAGAKDFTDDSKLTYKEAVDVVSALKIVDGYKDGSFNPQATLTRGAAAKIICNMILGPTTASALVADAAPYKDVPANHTFAGYIAYCQKEGIISGYADGTFRPANTLTGYAFMKMLLGALGYDSDVEGYTGPNWSIAVAKRALNAGLADDMKGDFNGVKAVTREEAALFAFNTLKADMVEYDAKTSVSTGNTTVVIAGSKAQKVYNTTAKDYRTKASTQDNVKQFCEAYFTDLQLRNASAAADSFGRPSNTWFNDKTKIGTYAKTPDMTYYKNVKGKDIAKDLDLDKSDYYYFDIVVDGKDSNSILVDKNTDTKLASASGELVGTGSLVEVYKDDEVVTVVNTFLMKVDGEYDTKDEELDLAEVSDGLATLSYGYSFDLTLSSDDFADLKSFKDGDYVLVTAYKDGANYTIDSIVKAQSVTGSVTEYVDDDTVTLGGKEYSYNVTANSGAAANYQYELKADATLYLDAQGNVLWAEGVENDGTYIYVTQFRKAGFLTSKSDAEAYAYFLDGTEKAISLNKINGDKAKNAANNGDGVSIDIGSNNYAPGWYTYTLKDTGKYDLKKVTSTPITPKADGTVTDYDSQKTDLGNGTYFGNKNTKFIIVDSKGDVKVATGIKNVPDTTVSGSGAVVSAVLDGTTYAKYVFIDVDNGTVKGGNASSDKMFVLKVDATYGHDSDSDTYYRYKVILNGEKKTVKIDSGETIALGSLYNEIEYNSKGYIVDETLVTTDDDFYANTTALTTGAKFQYKNQTVVMTLSDSSKVNFYMADNAKIYYITDKDDVSTITGSALTKKDPLTVGSTVFAEKNGDKEVSALYIYVK